MNLVCLGNIIFQNSSLSMYLFVDEISVEYFSVLAERRRVALTEALEENEQLHREIDSLKSENATLKAENSVLKPLAEETEYLAGIVKVSCSTTSSRLILFTIFVILILISWLIVIYKDLIGNAEDEGGNDGVTETEVDDKEDKATQSES